MQTSNGKITMASLINISQPKQDNWRNLKCKFHQQKVHEIKKNMTLPPRESSCDSRSLPETPDGGSVEVKVTCNTYERET